MIDMRTERLMSILRSFDLVARRPEIADAELARIGLDRDGVSSGALRLQPGAEISFLFAACNALGNSGFATLAGLSYRDTTVQTACITKYSRTLRQAIDHSTRYYQTLDPGLQSSLHVSGTSASFELQCSRCALSEHHRYVEFLMFSALSRMRRMTTESFLPIEIRFAHAAPEAARAINHLAGFPVTFGAARCEMLLPLSALKLPIPNYDPSLRAHLAGYSDRTRRDGMRSNGMGADQRDAQPGLADLRERVESVLIANLPGQVVQADDVAGNLGMSRRTFARRMREQGLSYRGILDDLRCDLACGYLRNGFSINEISFFLDYADPAAFSTAFRRWTGTSPNQYRRQALS